MAYEILIVDDEADIRTLVSGILKDEGYEPRTAMDGPSALEAVKARCPSLVILDIWLGDSRFDGIKVLELLKKDYPDLPVIIMSGHGTVETAVSAIKKGAYDFIEKPFKVDCMLLVVERALEAATLKRENQSLKDQAPFEDILIGRSSALQQLKQSIERIAQTGSRILITGPYGVGKEDIARTIHKQSKRARGPFIRVNCSSISPEDLEIELFGHEPTESHAETKIGLLEQAHMGTLFLDEVSDSPLSTQSKLVRFLQEQSFTRAGGSHKVAVDVRVIASTSRNLKLLIEQELFREDLYYRLNIVELVIPSLKERREDIPALAKAMFHRASVQAGAPLRELSQDALAMLKTYDWPGNLRHLKNVLDWTLMMASSDNRDIITAEMLPANLSAIGHGQMEDQAIEYSPEIMNLPLREAREIFEKNYLLGQLNRFSGNISQTAHFVGMERSALHRKLRLLQVNRSLS